MLATKLDWLLVMDIDGKKLPRLGHYQGALPDFAKYLRTFGEAGTVKLVRMARYELVVLPWYLWGVQNIMLVIVCVCLTP